MKTSRRRPTFGKISVFVAELGLFAGGFGCGVVASRTVEVEVAVGWMISDGEIWRCGVVVSMTVLIDVGKIVFMEVAAVVRTISG